MMIDKEEFQGSELRDEELRKLIRQTQEEDNQIIIDGLVEMAIKVDPEKYNVELNEVVRGND